MPAEAVAAIVEALAASAARRARLPLSVTISWGDLAKTDSETTQVGLKAAAEAAQQRLPSIADGDAARKYIPSLAHRQQTRLYRVVPPAFSYPENSPGCTIPVGDLETTGGAPRSKARQELFMVKERKRGNREAKKPKAIKPAADPNPPLMAAGRFTPIKPLKKAH